MGQKTDFQVFKSGLLVYQLAITTLARLWLSKLGGDISIGGILPLPLLVEIELKWMPKLGGEQSTYPYAHRRVWFSSFLAFTDYVLKFCS